MEKVALELPRHAMGVALQRLLQGSPESVGDCCTDLAGFLDLVRRNLVRSEPNRAHEINQAFYGEDGIHTILERLKGRDITLFDPSG